MHPPPPPPDQNNFGMSDTIFISKQSKAAGSLKMRILQDFEKFNSSSSNVNGGQLNKSKGANSNSNGVEKKNINLITSYQKLSTMELMAVSLNFYLPTNFNNSSK